MTLQGIKLQFIILKNLTITLLNVYINSLFCPKSGTFQYQNTKLKQGTVQYTVGNRQKPFRTKDLVSKNEKTDKSPPVKMTRQTKALP
jgi:hypothetical protein